MLVTNRQIIKNERIPEVPDLVKFAAGDDYFTHVVSFDSPAQGNGGMYTQDYWQSVIDGMRNRGAPIAGGKTQGNGHTALENDFFVVGALHDRVNNRVYFKLVVPQEGFSTSNVGLIHSLKNGVGGFSIVATPKIGNSANVFVEELGIPRLDYVDMGAMTQENYNVAENKLIDFVRKNNIEYAKIYNILHEQLNGGNVMDKDQILNALRNLVSTGQVSAEEIAGIGNIKQRTNADEEAARTLASVVELLGLPEGAAIEAIKAALDELFAAADVATSSEAETEAAEIAQTENRDNAAYKTALGLIKNYLSTQRIVNRAHGNPGKRVNIKEYTGSSEFKNNELLKVALELNAKGVKEPITNNFNWRSKK
jgi:hypothetical protein